MHLVLASLLLRDLRFEFLPRDCGRLSTWKKKIKVGRVGHFCFSPLMPLSLLSLFQVITRA